MPNTHTDEGPVEAVAFRLAAHRLTENPVLPALAPGGVVVTNDSYLGGTHLNDVTLIYPIFDGDIRVFFAAVREHWADFGGAVPGTMSGSATEIYQEGIRIPPVKLVERGRMNQAAMEILLANMRVPEERLGDFDSGLAAGRTAERRVRELIERHNLIGGIDTATGKEFVHYEWSSGGNGGCLEADGPSAMAAIDWGDLSTVQPTEVLEAKFPLDVESGRQTTDSGGPGRTCGGLGTRRSLKLTRGNARYSLLSDGAMVPPFGILGGESGAPGRELHRQRRWAPTVPDAGEGRRSSDGRRRSDCPPERRRRRLWRPPGARARNGARRRGGRLCLHRCGP